MISEGSLLLFGLLLLLGALFRQTLLFLFAAVSLLASLASWLWQRYCFEGVTYRRILSQRRAFFDEEIDLVQAGDPVRRIHWKASARLGSLHVKLLEPTTHARLAIFLDMQTLAGLAWWAGYDPLLVELSVIVAASIAAWAADQKFPVGLYVNGQRFRSAGGGIIELPPSEHPEQLHAILEALATIMPVPTMPLDDLLITQAPGLPWGTTVLAITAIGGPDLIAALRHLRREGRSTGLVLVGTKTEAPPAPGIPVFHIRGEETWRDLTSVALA